MRIVLDTNVLLPSIRFRSQLRWVFDAVLDGRLKLIVSTPILMEYEEVIGRRTTPEVASNVLDVLQVLSTVEEVEPTYRWRLVPADPDDDKFADAAIASGADALVTHDGHFSEIDPDGFPPLVILSTEELRKRLE